MGWTFLDFRRPREWIQKMTEFKDYKNFGEEKEADVQYFCKLTFLQFFTILVLEVVTLAFLFYLGAKYGTTYLKIADEDKPAVTEIVAGTASDTPAIQDRDIQQMAKDVVEGGSEADLKKKVKEMMEKQSTGQQVSKSPGQEVGMSAGQQVVSAQPTAPAIPATQAAATEQPASPADTGAIRMKSPEANQYSVQVGSYPSMSEASTKVEEWRTKGYPSFMMIADISDRGRWYRVRIGGFGTKEDAQKYLEKFKENEGIDGIVVLNEQ